MCVVRVVDFSRPRGWKRSGLKESCCRRRGHRLPPTPGSAYLHGLHANKWPISVASIDQKFCHDLKTRSVAQGPNHNCHPPHQKSVFKHFFLVKTAWIWFVFFLGSGAPLCTSVSFRRSMLFILPTPKETLFAKSYFVTQTHRVFYKMRLALQKNKHLNSFCDVGVENLAHWAKVREDKYTTYSWVHGHTAFVLTS